MSHARMREPTYQRTVKIPRTVTKRDFTEWDKTIAGVQEGFIIDIVHTNKKKTHTNTN